jgi:hypothetical protein
MNAQPVEPDENPRESATVPSWHGHCAAWADEVYQLNPVQAPFAAHFAAHPSNVLTTPIV